MSVIIRLQGLPWTANALDIRRYFQGLTIPEGGVHIVGGESGDAFIAFSTDEDARCAMLMDSGRIKDEKIKLQLSSRTEMQKVIEAARNRNLAMQGLLTQGSGSSLAQTGASVGNTTGVLHQPQQVPPSPGILVPGMSMTDSIMQQMYSRGILPMQGQPFSGLPMSASNLGLSDMRHVMMQNVPSVPMDSAVVSGGGGGMSSAASYEPTKKSGSERSDRDRRDRDKDRDRDRDRRSRSSRSPRRRSSRDRDRDRDRDGGGRRDYGDRDRRDRRRSNSRGRSGGPNDSMDRQKFSPRRGSLDGFSSGGAPRDVDNRRGAAAAAGGGEGPPSMDMRAFHGPDGPGRRFGEPNIMMNENGRNLASAPPLPTPQPQNARRGDRSMESRWNGDRGGGGRGSMGVGDRQENLRGTNNNMWNPTSDQMMRGSGPGPFGRQFNSGLLGGGGGGGGGQRTHCIMIRGIPFDTHPRMVRNYFAGLTIPAEDGIRLFADDRSNVAFVRFTSEHEREMVLKQKNQSFHDVLVEILPCTEEEMERAPVFGGGGGAATGGGPQVPEPWNNHQHQPSSRQPQQQQRTSEETCIVMKGLSFKCFKEDVIKFFDGFRVVDVMILFSRPGKAAFVEFSSPVEARRAVALNGKKMDFRTIELTLCTKEDMINAKHHGIDNNNSSRGGRPGGGGGGADINLNNDQSKGIDSNNSHNFADNQIFDCCLIMGLPLSATDRDILDFLTPVEVVPVAIHIMLDGNGRPVGDAFCEFTSPHDCFLAVKRDGYPLRPESRFFLNIRPVTRRELQEALGVAPMGPPQQSEPGRSTGLLSSPRTAAPFNTDRRGGGGGMMPMDWSMMDNPLRQGSPMHHDGGMQKQQQQDQPGCVMDVQNLPYRATYDDILRHFKGFGLTKDRIMRRFTENGLPTGDARLFFPTPKDAQNVLRQLNYHTLLGRTVTLRIVRDM